MSLAEWLKTAKALGTVLVVGLVLGAGLPALFSFGVASLYSDQPENGGAVAITRNPLRQAAGWASFALVALAVLFGIAVIMEKVLKAHFGLDVTFWN
ncbi:MAG: hypothetical protein ACRC20_15175 [Segniliparus sp.]|uniref:hypothetical protein n=1 Tax=Segniliparus sp. TaxID=2804064 RepID=UPI003F308A16